MSWPKTFSNPTNEEEAQGGELDEPDGWVAEVEPVHAEHPQEDGEEEGGVEAVSVGPGAVHLL